MIFFVFIVVFSYLLGSIPFGYILVRIFRGQDVRESGSGNIGATNVARSSPVLGLLTLLLDAAKGLCAVGYVQLIINNSEPTYGSHKLHPLVYATLAALIAVIGHMFPVWLKFKGGKGVATALGSFVLIAPKAILISIGIFVVTLLLFRLVSLSSILTVALFPVLFWLMHEHRDQVFVLAMVAACSLMIVLKHHTNIKRLLNHAEPRFQLRAK
ncbi:MAG TPA: glycerol-3-phosphate 1-O-acyltransferase PlsY [Terriglobales bacterium]|nr:glycerol-3-phosphate 1-O-acyltransferase PlsY [Terriglobales bacterium]